MGVGVIVGYFIRQLIMQQRKSSIEAKLKKLVEDSKIEAKEVLFEAKEKAAKVLDEIKHEEKDRLSQVRRHEERLIERETAVERRAGDFERKEKEFEDQVIKVKAAKAEIEVKRDELLKELERISGLSAKEAVEEIMRRVEKEQAEDIMVRIKKLESAGMEDLER